jgi:alpha-tubulin suppressor-like RCC1 family protein
VQLRCLFALLIVAGCRREATIRPPDDRLVAISPVGAAVTPRVLQLSLGRYHACAVQSDGAVRCVGRNDYGQLGDGSTEDRSRATRVAGIHDALEVAIGDYHTCVRRVDRTVACFGYNATGQLGDGTHVDRATPWPVVAVEEAESLALGSHHSCARLGDGTVRCWGYNGDGELGDGTTVDRVIPVRAKVSGVQRIVAGSYHSCALGERGSVLCWGSNMAGQLGDGTMINRHEPTAVAGLSGAVELSLGFAHTCARGDGLYCWGANFQAQLGDGTRDAQLSPKRIGLANVTQIALGFAHSCARTADGRAHCWGDVRAPLDRELLDVRSISVAGATTCVELTSGAVRCDGWEFFERLVVP